MNEPYYSKDGITIYCGDCLEVLRQFPDCCLDSVVTDPPYGLSFMGKKWDYDVPRVEIWREVQRVLKPGGHLLSFAGTRTQHRMAVNIEDAGFEIRDMIAWVYATGFPKGVDVAWNMHLDACKWHGSMVLSDHESVSGKSAAEYRMRFVRAAYLSAPVYACDQCGQVLQPFVPEQDAQKYRKAWTESEALWSEQPSMEGRRDVEASARQLSRCEVCTLSHGIYADGAQGRLYHGASSSDGPPPWAVAEADGSCPSYRSQSIEQLNREPSAFCVERRAQEARGFNVALKPALEPITVARKPLSGTVAANVLEHGTGAINVDGCRVGTDEALTGGAHGTNPTKRPEYTSTDSGPGAVSFSRFRNGAVEYRQPSGRFPANLIHDGSDEVVGLFPETKSGRLAPHHKLSASENTCMSGPNQERNPRREMGNDSGSAARFFYCAKASRKEREAGCAGIVQTQQDETRKQGDPGGDNPRNRGASHRGNSHPTVKPLALMRYLVRLITPVGGVVLDPFMGSGTTLIAAKQEGFAAVGIEIEERYCEIAVKRLAQGVLL